MFISDGKRKMKRKTIASLIAVAAVVAVAMFAGCVEDDEKTAPLTTSENVNAIEMYTFGPYSLYIYFTDTDGRSYDTLHDGNTEVKIKTYCNSKLKATKTVYIGPGERFSGIDMPDAPENALDGPNSVNVEITLPNGKKVSADLDIDRDRFQRYSEYHTYYSLGAGSAEKGYSPLTSSSFSKREMDAYYDGYYGFTPRYTRPDNTKIIRVA